MPSVSFFFPCYNDAGTIGTLVILAHKKLALFTNDYEVIVVDDGSTDTSSKILEQLKTIYPTTLKVVRHKQNSGYGAALITGFKTATKDWVGYTDGDAQYDLDELDRMFPLIRENVDWVQGFKGIRRDPIYRIWVGKIYQKFIKLIFGLKITDVDCDFRLMRRSELQKITLTRTTGCICIELVKKLELVGARFVEVQVSHYFRLHGKSQFFNFVRVSKTLLAIGKLWFDVFELRYRSHSSLKQLKDNQHQQEWQEYKTKMDSIHLEAEEIKIDSKVDSQIDSPVSKIDSPHDRI